MLAGASRIAAALEESAIRDTHRWGTPRATVPKPRAAQHAPAQTPIERATFHFHRSIRADEI